MDLIFFSRKHISKFEFSILQHQFTYYIIWWLVGFLIFWFSYFVLNITGKVYKGILSTNQHVAIKHIINDGNVETFAREVTSLSHIRHPNLVTLLGYCVNEDECFLVYELCPNGNLSEWLFGMYIYSPALTSSFSLLNYRFAQANQFK